MDCDRPILAAIGAVIIVAILLLAGLVISPVYIGKGDMEGDWHLSYVKGYDKDGNNISHEVSESSWDIRVDDVSNGTVTGSLGGLPFAGSAVGNVMRFQMDTPENKVQVIGCLYVPEVLMASVVICNGINGSISSYNLTFTRDGTVPHMIDSFFMNITGDWITNAITSSNEFMKDVSMTVLSQDTTVACGKISYNGSDNIEFRIVFSMLENASMNYGMLIDESGGFWILSVKKGFIAMYDAAASGTDVRGTGVYMTRNPGDTVVQAPMSVGGTSWTGATGYMSDGSYADISGYSLNLIWQSDCMISGDMTFEGNEYRLVGTFVINDIKISMTRTIAAELCINVNGSEVNAMLFSDGNTVTITPFNGTLPEGMKSMGFVR